MLHHTVSIGCLWLSAVFAFAGEYNPVLSIGNAAPAWSGLPGVDDKQHALADLKAQDAVVVAFTCNSCPYAVDYEDRLIAFAKEHCGPEGRVALVAINVNLVEEDRLPAMKERAGNKGFGFPYLFDETQKIANAYGATFTPEFFVLDRDRKIVYMGAMDDNTDAAKAKVNYVEAAVEAVAAGKAPEVKETVGRGCLVRYERRRKK
jgi:peroxiredoxin